MGLVGKVVSAPPKKEESHRLADQQWKWLLGRNFQICQELHLWQDAEDFISTKSYVLGEKKVFNYFKS